MRSRTILFWSLLALSLAVNAVIFKDLADISQWLVQSSREFTMAVWYHRHWLALVAIGSLAGAWLLWLRDRSLAPRWVTLSVTLLGLFLFYSGYVNPRLMFRTQQHEAQFVPVSEARARLERTLPWARFGWQRYASVDDISMIVLETDRGALAYSDYFILQPHVAKAAPVNGEDVVMTYCGLTNMGIAYSPEIDGQPLELGVMTQLENNLVLWDHNTGEPIQQIYGRMEGRPERGKMREWPTIRMPFASFAALYPDGLVYVNEIPSFSENPLLAAWDRLTRHVMMYNGVSLQWAREAPAFPTIERFDDRLPRKQLVYALSVGDDHVAWTLDYIREQGDLINTRVGGRDIVIAYDARWRAVGAFYNDSGAPVTSINILGEIPGGRTLPRVETLKSEIFWFIWAHFHPDTDVNRAPAGGGDRIANRSA
ncbi:MAG: DUF3179 domain-containing protein [Gammaproteobacteria bacterium]|nr:MAG: DUF3179 domain-containing protein [Gammaproteobacteria bacterium]